MSLLLHRCGPDCKSVVPENQCVTASERQAAAEWKLLRLHN